MAKRNQSQHEGQPELAAKATTIVVDYNGLAAKRPGERGIAHIRSPFIANLYRDGVKTLPFTPGVNILNRELFDRYAAGCTDVRMMMESGQIREMHKLPAPRELTAAKTGLIDRTVSQPGLAWIEDQAMAATLSEDDRDDIVALINKRRPYARPLGYRPKAFQSHRGIDEAYADAKGRKAQPSHVGV